MAQKREKSLIFVVDDEEIIASTVAAILRLKGLEASAFSQPFEALAASRLQAPDLLISDVAMPLLSGIDLAIQLQDDCPTCKVLLFTGQLDAANLVLAARRDGYQFDLLLKPVHPTGLLKKVREMMERVPPPSNTGEDLARRQLAENMRQRQTVDEVRADIASSEARKRSTKEHGARDSGN
jgi:FixJ family two-component response regulator